MHTTTGRVRRGLLGTCLITAMLTVFGVGTASAQITASNITSPGSPYVYQFDANATPTPVQTITGTTNSTDPTNDTVDIVCTYNTLFGGSASVTVATGVALAGDGSFTYTGPVNVNGASCTLRAVPSPFNNTSALSTYTGPFAELDRVRTVGGPGGTEVDFQDSASGSAATNYFRSAGSDCSLNTEPIKPVDAYSNAGWFCAGSLLADDALNARTSIVIDGRNAYTSNGAANAYTDSGLGESSAQAAGYPNIASSYQRAGDTSGNAVVGDVEALVSCADASFPASQAKCGGTPGSNIGSWNSDGVTLTRTSVQSDSGQLVTVYDQYKSTDGIAHGIDVEYSNAGYTSWRFPGMPDSAEFTPGDQVNLGGDSVDAIYTTSGSLNYDQNLTASAALIFTTQPNLAEFNGSGNLLLDYRRTIPAGGTITIGHTYVSGWNSAVTNQLAASFTDGYHKPSVSITSPANNNVSASSTVVVRGKAVAHDGLTLKVNGQSTPVNSDGTWSIAVPLNKGTNTIVAAASDLGGNTTQASVKVTYNPNAAFCIVPNVTHDKVNKARSALKKAGCKVGKVRNVYSRTFAKHRVEHASYGNGTVLASGTKVGLTVSKGKKRK